MYLLSTISTLDIAPNRQTAIVDVTYVTARNEYLEVLVLVRSLKPSNVELG